MKVEYKEQSCGPLPLEGIKVVEYGVFHAGPGGGAILGDLGAEVIKIEAAGGDPIRYWTSVGDIDMSAPNGESLTNEVSNRNKKNICLDINTEAGREILHRLVKEADVFMTNLRKTTKSKLGVDYQTLSKINPNIIHANVSGYGPEGPMQNIGAFDPLGQACSGMMFVTGSELPSPIQIGVLDQATAITLSHAILTALLVRERQGIAQEVHVSLYGSALWLQHINLMLSNVSRIDPSLSGDRNQHSPLRNVFVCSDNKWVMCTHHPDEKYWATFCKVMGRLDLLENPDYTDEKERPLNYPELNALFDQIFLTRTRDEWMIDFMANELMFAPIQRINNVENDPQALLNQYVIPCDYPGIGKINVPGYPVHFSKSQAGVRSSAPQKGEHTDEIMRDLGFEADAIEDLKKKSVIQ
ncbi:MAG: CoA transferase [Deltaproteobacteria bacterium]|nr:CoA transferase [Deltaproteobacteria bacterium]MBT4091476.1 CoA transferase [Deltaproteobacteria bacterium]MBT4269401.1 CoA transferase [Deltaproteobacteria bacterium]MBT4644814.1 CoA transferase [Deltaproteobacteria bacterium]MBT6498296.1 CoA transferase [Deltaproteobacteria bacterium]